MSVSEFFWPPGIFPIKTETLQSVDGRDKLLAILIPLGRWSSGTAARIRWHALVLYCVRTGHNPGRLLTDAIRSSKCWWSQADERAAKASIGIGSPQQPAADGSCDTPHGPDPRLVQLDQQINRLTDDQAVLLLPHPTSRDLFRRALKAGRDPRGEPKIRMALRRALMSTDGQRVLSAVTQRAPASTENGGLGR